jgi:cell division septation protein DedD
MEHDDYGNDGRDLRAPLRLMPPRRRFRWLTGAIAGLALALFGFATWYAYVLGIRAGSGDQVPLVRSDQKPEKVRPQEPGGMNVPHQDKTVYDRVAPEVIEKPAEQLLPPAEEPVARPKEQAAQPPSAQPSAPPSAPVENKGAEVKLPEQKPSEKKAAETKPETKTGTPAPSAAPKVALGAGGPYRVQIGAFRSEAEAAAAIAKLKSAHADLLGNVALTAQRADLGEKGIYYRVQSGVLGEGASDKSLCESLRKRNVGCLIVRP